MARLNERLRGGKVHWNEGEREGDETHTGLRRQEKVRPKTRRDGKERNSTRDHERRIGSTQIKACYLNVKDDSR